MGHWLDGNVRKTLVEIADNREKAEEMCDWIVATGITLDEFKEVWKLYIDWCEAQSGTVH